MKIAIGRMLEANNTFIAAVRAGLQQQQAETMSLRDRCTRLEMASVHTYICPVCGSTDRTKYARCEMPNCPDGRDQSAAEGAHKL